ncbi:hypothetical protein EJ08DRAFT_453190 [Tothia fuscella]|uniref:Uncharacterized protein n=1 Tax=Tothia fuscella TaxID=1048955 RepID=A0A9P4NJ73_9PEZI|nr:hypothetical protein EJ08DRAFT_453190 [Tothia fuscella]
MTPLDMHLSECMKVCDTPLSTIAQSCYVLLYVYVVQQLVGSGMKFIKRFFGKGTRKSPSRQVSLQTQQANMPNINLEEDVLAPTVFKASSKDKGNGKATEQERPNNGHQMPKQKTEFTIPEPIVTQRERAKTVLYHYFYEERQEVVEPEPDTREKKDAIQMYLKTETHFSKGFFLRNCDRDRQCQFELTLAALEGRISWFPMEAVEYEKWLAKHGRHLAEEFDLRPHIG